MVRHRILIHQVSLPSALTHGMLRYHVTRSIVFQLFINAACSLANFKCISPVCLQRTSAVIGIQNLKRVRAADYYYFLNFYYK